MCVNNEGEQRLFSVIPIIKAFAMNNDTIYVTTNLHFSFNILPRSR